MWGTAVWLERADLIVWLDQPPLTPIWRRFRPVGVAYSAEPDWPFRSRLGSLRARAE